jgi:hypothetical protein
MIACSQSFQNAVAMYAIDIGSLGGACLDLLSNGIHLALVLLGVFPSTVRTALENLVHPSPNSTQIDFSLCEEYRSGS